MNTLIITHWWSSFSPRLRINFESHVIFPYYTPHTTPDFHWPWPTGQPARIKIWLNFFECDSREKNNGADIRTRPIWSSTISEVDLITKNSQIDWQQCSTWRGKRSWDQVADLWWQRSLQMMMTHTGNLSSLRWQEVARRQGAEEVAVIWAYSVALVWLLRFVSKRFVNEIINWLDYQSNISKSLIIKAFDNQAQEPNNQINQSWRKSLICSLGKNRTDRKKSNTNC